MSEKNSKALQVVKNVHGKPHMVIAWVGGGEVPEDLSGLYTNAETAQRDIKRYMAMKTAKMAKSAAKKTKAEA